MHLHDQTVGTGGDGRHGQRFHEPVIAAGMRGVDHNGQMAHALDGGNGGHIQRIAGLRLKGADAPLAQDDILIAVANWSMKTATAEITLPKELVDAQYVFEMETVNTRNCWYDITPPWRLSIKPCDLRVFRLVGKKPQK